MRAFIIGLLLSATAFAIDSEVQRYVTDGDAFLNQGEPFYAEKQYVTGKGVAVDKEDIDGLLLLTDRFIRTRSDYHAHDSFYLANDFAETICTFAGNAANKAAECARGIAAMNACIAAGQNLLATLAMTPKLAGEIRNTMNIATDNVRIYVEKGCP
jgi:hypothetical protein